jgi:hypothetical protein
MRWGEQDLAKMLQNNRVKTFPESIFILITLLSTTRWQLWHWWHHLHISKFHHSRSYCHFKSVISHSQVLHLIAICNIIKIYIMSLHWTEVIVCSRKGTRNHTAHAFNIPKANIQPKGRNEIMYFLKKQKQSDLLGLRKKDSTGRERHVVLYFC